MSLRNAQDSQFLRPRCEQTPAYQKSGVGLLPFEPNVCGMCSTHFELFVVVLFLCIPDCGYYFKITTFIVKCSDWLLEAAVSIGSCDVWGNIYSSHSMCYILECEPSVRGEEQRSDSDALY